MQKATRKNAPKKDATKEPLYRRKTVFIRDNILSKYAGIDVIGVQDRGKELHLELYIKYPDGKILHRDIEISPDGSFDAGTIVDQDAVRASLKAIEKDIHT
jgi:hypothetical protein